MPSADFFTAIEFLPYSLIQDRNRVAENRVPIPNTDRIPLPRRFLKFENIPTIDYLLGSTVPLLFLAARFGICF